MRTQTARALVSVMIVLSSCGMPASAPPEPGLTPGPRPIGCLPIEEAILGVWQRDGSVEELRRDGTYVLNGVEGAFRWRSPGHVVLDVNGTHSEHVVALTDVTELVSADENLVAHVSVRISPPPPIPPACYDLTSSVVGTWLSEGEPETFAANGTFRSGERSARWSALSNGRLAMQAGDERTERVFAHLSDTTALGFVREPGARVTLYRRAP